MIESKTYDEVCHIMALGYEYAQRLHAAGHFDHLRIGDMDLDHLQAAERHGNDNAAAAGGVPAVNGASASLAAQQ